MKKVSVILPVYNSEKTIERTIQSVINQTYKSYELIIVNDGSEDQSDKICRKNASNYENIKYFKRSNSGVSTARNFGISNSTGEYIMFLDSDDEYKSNMIEELIKEIENDNDLAVCGYKRVLLENSHNRDTTIKDIKMNENVEMKNFIEALQSNGLFNQIWNKIYKKSIIDNNNIKFDSTTSIGEDYKFNLNYIKNINKASYINKVLYTYYSSIQGLNFKYNENKLSIKLSNLEEQKKLYENNNFDLEYIYRLYILTCLSGISEIASLKNNEREEAINKFINNKQMYKNIKEIKLKTSKVLNKIMINVFFSRNKIIVLLYAKVLKVLKRIYRKMKIE